MLNWCYRYISQILQCARQMSHNAPLCNRNVHTCTFLLQSGASWDMKLVHCGLGAQVYWGITGPLRLVMHMGHGTGSSLKVMTCCQFSAKTLHEPIMSSMIFEWKHDFLLKKKMDVKMSFAECQPFLLRPHVWNEYQEQMKSISTQRPIYSLIAWLISDKHGFMTSMAFQ